MIPSLTYSMGNEKLTKSKEEKDLGVLFRMICHMGNTLTGLPKTYKPPGMPHWVTARLVKLA